MSSPGPAVPAASAPSAPDYRQFRLYSYLVHIFVVVLLVSNLIAQKIVEIPAADLGFITLGPFLLSAAQILFPITYIFGDVMVEVYGYSASRRAIWIGFGAAAVLALMCLFATALPPAPSFQNQAAFEAVFGITPRILVASLIAYWAGEFANAFVMSKMKMLTNGKYLWTRTVGSTAVGQLVDSTLVMIIGFAGTQPWSVIFTLIYSGYIFKVGYEALATPLTYKIVGYLKRVENVDVYDQETDFNPFG